MMWNELGISGGTAIIILIALYFVIKWAVKHGVKEAYKDIKNEKNQKNCCMIYKINKSKLCKNVALENQIFREKKNIKMNKILCIL